MAREVICGIYKITNMVNGKVYIGQARDIYKRWAEHRSGCKTKRKNVILYCALAKYGLDNFSFEILAKCEEFKLNELEIQYIKYYNSYVGFDNAWGYNMTLGGQLCKTYVGTSDQGVPTYQYDLDGNFIAEYRNRQRAAEAIGLTESSAITQAIGKKGTSGGYQWRDFHVDKITPYSKNRATMKVYQYGLDGHYMQEFASVLEASNIVNCSRSLIELCCEGRTKTAKNFQWSYERKEDIGRVAPMLQPNKWREVFQYSKDGAFMQSFPCAKVASELTNVSLRAIQHNLCGESKTAYGYIFTYEKKGGENGCKKK